MREFRRRGKSGGKTGKTWAQQQTVISAKLRHYSPKGFFLSLGASFSFDRFGQEEEKKDNLWIISNCDLHSRRRARKKGKKRKRVLILFFSSHSEWRKKNVKKKKKERFSPEKSFNVCCAIHLTTYYAILYYVHNTQQLYMLLSILHTHLRYKTHTTYTSKIQC